MLHESKTAIKQNSASIRDTIRKPVTVQKTSSLYDYQKKKVTYSTLSTLSSTFANLCNLSNLLRCIQQLTLTLWKQVSQLKQGLADRTAKTAVSVAI